MSGNNKVPKVDVKLLMFCAVYGQNIVLVYENSIKMTVYERTYTIQDRSNYQGVKNYILMAHVDILLLLVQLPEYNFVNTGFLVVFCVKAYPILWIY